MDIATGRQTLGRRSRLPPYLGNNALPEEATRRLGYRPPDIYGDRPNIWQPPNLWVGNRGTISPLHKDGPDNFVHQLYGVKRWTIFPPSDLLIMNCTLCYSSHMRNNGLCHSHTLGLINRCSQIPRGAHPITFDLFPGEVYYQPASWLHSVINLGDTIMVNQWLQYDARPQVLEII